MKSIRRIAALFTVLLLTLLLAFPAAANAPEPEPVYRISLANLPDGTVYVDLLIQLSEDDPHYSPLVAENVPEGFAADAEILSYCKNGYRSYTFHYQNAESSILPQQSEDSNLPYVRFLDEFFEHYKDLQKRGAIKLAMLDHSGNILQVSSPLQLHSIFIHTTYQYTYDAQADALQNGYLNRFAVCSYLVISAYGIAFTILLEWLISLLFRLNRRAQTTVVLTNLASQILMRGLFWLLFCTVLRNYVILTILLELLVYVGEFLVYCWRMKEVSIKKRLIFTCTANTVTLVLGLVLNPFLYF